MHVLDERKSGTINFRYVVTTASGGLGDSGGAILDRDGKLIGLLNAVHSKNDHPDTFADNFVERKRGVKTILGDSEILSIGVSVCSDILEYLEEDLTEKVGEGTFEKVIRGEEIDIYPKDMIKERRMFFLLKRYRH